MSFPGNVFDRQLAQRDSDEIHKDSRNLAISLAIALEATSSLKGLINPKSITRKELSVYE